MTPRLRTPPSAQPTSGHRWFRSPTGLYQRHEAPPSTRHGTLVNSRGQVARLSIPACIRRCVTLRPRVGARLEIGHYGRVPRQRSGEQDMPTPGEPVARGTERRYLRGADGRVIGVSGTTITAESRATMDRIASEGVRDLVDSPSFGWLD